MPKKDGTPTLTERLIKAAKERNFTYDDCTASPNFDFGDCCNEHDYDYQDLTKTRLEADNDLAKCMWCKSIRGKLLAPVYWVFVRVFGVFYWKEKQVETLNKILDGSNDASGPPGANRL